MKSMNIIKYKKDITDILCGRIIEERYYIEKYMCSGGMSVIFSGTRVEDNRRIIIKACEHDQTTYRKALKNEYDVLNLINGYNKTKNVLNSNIISNNTGKGIIAGIPQVYDYFTKENTDFLVMEYIQGKTLDNAFKMNDHSDDTRMKILLLLCHVIQYLHDMPVPVYHCDIKPSNIIIGEDKDGDSFSSKGCMESDQSDTRDNADIYIDHEAYGVTLIDYGTAVTGHDRHDIIRKMSGRSGITGFGTLAYAAPEQFISGGSVTDVGTDIYAIGVLLKYSAEYFEDKRTASGLIKIAKRCTFKHIKRRYANMAEVICELMTIAGFEGCCKSLII